MAQSERETTLGNKWPSKTRTMLYKFVSSAALILRVCLAFGGTVNGRQQNLPSLNGVCICGWQKLQEKFVVLSPERALVWLRLRKSH